MPTQLNSAFAPPGEHTCSIHVGDTFLPVENSPILPLSCFPSKFSSNWKVVFWHYFLVPEVNFFLPFYFLSLFFSWCSGCFIHPGSCAELFPFPITPSSDAPGPTLLTQPVPRSRKLHSLSRFSALAAYPAPHYSVAGARAGNVVDLWGLPEHFPEENIPSYEMPRQGCSWNRADLKKRQDVLQLAKVLLTNSTKSPSQVHFNCVPRPPCSKSSYSDSCA